MIFIDADLMFTKENTFFKSILIQSVIILLLEYFT